MSALREFDVIEVFVHGIGAGGMLVQKIQPQLARPPVPIGSADAGGVVEGAFAFFTHLSLSLAVICKANNSLWGRFPLCYLWLLHGRRHHLAGPLSINPYLSVCCSFVSRLAREELD